MGLTNFGNQLISINFYAPADSAVVNKRFVDIRPTGIYKGGYPTKVSNTQVSVSKFVAELRDTDYQVRVETQTAATIDVAVATPLVVIRWAYSGVVDTWADLVAIAEVDRQENDLVVCLCQFSGAVLTGFSLADRSSPMVFDKFMKVEPTEVPSMRVHIRTGRTSYGTSNILIEDQVSALIQPPVANSRWDLVYIDTDHLVKIQTGTPALVPTKPDYGGKIVLAELLITSTMTAITWADIHDVRSLIASTNSTFLLLFDTPSSYTGQAGMTLKVKSDETGLEFGGANFSNLSDGPGSYIGNANKLVKVNAGETGLTYGYIPFTTLTDVPSNYTGQAGKALIVNPTATGLMFGALDFKTLTDTPASYTGFANYILKVKSDETGVVFGRVTLTDLTDFPGNYTGQAGKTLVVKQDETGMSFSKLAFTALSDAPTSYTGNALKFVRVKSDASGLEFAYPTYAP